MFNYLVTYYKSLKLYCIIYKRMVRFIIFMGLLENDPCLKKELKMP